MASSKDYLQFVLEQLSELQETIYTSSRTGETVVPWSAAYIYEEVIRPEGYRLRQHMHLHKRPPRKKVAPIPSVIED